MTSELVKGVWQAPAAYRGSARRIARRERGSALQCSDRLCAREKERGGAALSFDD